MVVGALWTDYKDDENLKGMVYEFWDRRFPHEWFFFFFLVKIFFARYIFICCKQDKILYKIQLGKLLGKTFFYCILNLKETRTFLWNFLFIFVIQKEEFIFGLQSQILEKLEGSIRITNLSQEHKAIN